MSFIPYIKYVLAPDTRFERDHEIFFGPKGKVAKGEQLNNYGWSYGGLKELVRLYYEARKKTTTGFEAYYNSVMNHRGNVLDVMESAGIAHPPLRGLITARVHENLFLPILIVDFTAIRFKYCESCMRQWKQKCLPSEIERCLGNDQLSQRIRDMRCTRMACNHLCGNYQNCVLNYTSLEEDATTEKRIIDCLSALLELLSKGVEPNKAFECRQIETSDKKTKSIGPLKPDSKCFERPVRYDFLPIERRHVDPETWEHIQTQRLDHGAHHNVDLIPAHLMPDIFGDRARRTDVRAPLEAEGVFEKFIQMANIRFEIRIDLLHNCSVCGKQHRLLRLPITAMFKTDNAYIQEAGVGKMLWNLLWQEFPDQMCKNYPEECRINDSPVLKRELTVSSLSGNADNRDYDYAVDLEPLTGNPGWFLLNLTTGLWKKGGFHQTSVDKEEYVTYERDMLIQIPSTLKNAKSVWYVVIPSTQEQFFDETAPTDVADMNALVERITLGNKIQGLTPVIVFNSTPRTGEARTELRKLAAEKQFEQTKIYPVLEAMLQGVK